MPANCENENLSFLDRIPKSTDAYFDDNFRLNYRTK